MGSRVEGGNPVRSLSLIHIFSYYFGSRIVLAFLGLAGVVAFSGVDSFPLLVCTPAFGFFVPRVFLKLSLIHI